MSILFSGAIEVILSDFHKTYSDYIDGELDCYKCFTSIFHGREATAYRFWYLCVNLMYAIVCCLNITLPLCFCSYPGSSAIVLVIGVDNTVRSL